jgi:arylamine N-acetyltransferase
MAPRGGVAQAPGTHQAVMAHVDGQDYLVDVGNGAPFFDPLPTRATTEVRFGALAYRFRPADAPRVFLQERLLEGEWAPFCGYDTAPASADALAAGLKFHFTPGQSWVLGKLFLVRCTDDAVFAVARDGRLTTYPRTGGKHSEPVEGAEGYQRIARDVLGLPGLAMREALAVQAGLAR